MTFQSISNKDELLSLNTQLLLMMLKDMAKNFSANFLQIGNIRLVIINQFIRGFANSLVQCAISTYEQ
jgi:hypothetical protein